MCLSLCVTLSVCFGFLCYPSTRLGSASIARPPSLTEFCSSGIVIPFLGSACHLGTERLRPSGVAVQTKQGHFGTFLELCPPPNKHPEISATPVRRGQLPLPAVLCPHRTFRLCAYLPLWVQLEISSRGDLLVWGSVICLVCLCQEPAVPPLWDRNILCK